MTKFFAQLLLSLIVGFGAAATLDADVRDRLSHGPNRTRAHVQDVTHPGFELTNHMDLTAGAEVGSQSEVEAEVSASAAVEAEADIHFNRLVRKITKWFGEVDAETSLSAESENEAEAEVDANEASLDLENNLESELELDLGLGN